MKDIHLSPGVRLVWFDRCYRRETETITPLLPSISASLKSGYLDKANGRACPYCGKAMRSDDRQLRPTRDHVVPKKSKKARLGAPPIVIVCKRCNSHKGHKRLENWLAELESKDDHRALYVRGFVEKYLPKIEENAHG